jgi:hypothetical protein
LEVGFVAEAPFPTMKGGGTSVEDHIISLFPDCPSGNDEEFHEKNVWSLIFSFLHHGMERTIEVPKDA